MYRQCYRSAIYAALCYPYNNVFQRKADQPIIACCLRLDGKNQSESTFWIVVWGFKARDSLAVAATTPVTSNMLRKYSFLELWSRCHKARSQPAGRSPKNVIGTASGNFRWSGQQRPAVLHRLNVSVGGQSEFKEAKHYHTFPNLLGI